MARVIIGMDPHKRSATIEIINERETVLAQGRFDTSRDGYRAMLALCRKHKERIWAVEGCAGIGRHIAQRLVADGETVIDVPAKPSAQAWVFATGQGRKTDLVDAQRGGGRLTHQRFTSSERRPHHGRAAAAGRPPRRPGPRPHRRGQQAPQTPAGDAARRCEETPIRDAAHALLATVRPRDIVGRTRRQLAAELITELATIDKKIKAANRQLTELVHATGSNPLQLNGIGPSGAARLLGGIGDIALFASRGHFASWNGTAPLDASSGDQQRHRLSRAGNRRINGGYAHHGRCPAPPRHRGPRLLPTQTRSRQNGDASHARTQTTTVRHRLSADGQRLGH
jgi:transposase